MKHEQLHSELLDLAEILIDNDHQLQLRMQGFSMFPTLQPGDKGLVQKCSASNIKAGDIIVVRKNQTFIAHRLIRIETHGKDTLYICRGDQNGFEDKPAGENEVVGKLVSFERKGRVTNINTPKMNVIRWKMMNLPGWMYLRNKQLLRINGFYKAIHKHFSSLRRNYRLVSEGAIKQIHINGLLSVLLGILPFGIILAVKLIVDLLSAGQPQNINTGLLYTYIGATALIYLLNMLAGEIKSFTSEKLSQQVTRNMYKKLHAKHIALSLSHYEVSADLDKMHRAVQEASFRPVKLINELQTGLRSVVSSLFLMGIFLAIEWYLVLILVVAVLPGVAVRLLFARRFHHLKEKQSPAERRMYYFNRILTGFPFAKELRLYGFASWFLKQFGGMQDMLFKQKIDLRKSELRWNIITQLFSVLLIFVALFMVTYLMVQGSISIGTVVLFFFAFQRGYSVLNDLFRSLSRVVEDNIFLNDFVDFLNTDESIHAAQKHKKEHFSLKESIQINNLHFAYNSSTRNALNNLSLNIPAGKTVALVGENGSGKTTLIKLLCGFYLPQSGAILYDGKSTELLGQDEICSQVSTVFQDFAFYNLSVQENLKLSNIQRKYKKEEIVHALQLAGLSELITSLPQGIDTLLGNQFLGGEELSIGQWQKMAIARAFLRDAGLLLLDEPSSALDANSEAIIIQSLHQLTRNKTAIIVSHRLRAVQWADQIFFMENGSIAEQGTHAELMQLQGKYYNMYRKGSSEPVEQD
jgi:ATP-binding cassette subfamily B protein